VPTEPGIGVTIVEERVARATERSLTLSESAARADSR
jgi:hypothetical protein